MPVKISRAFNFNKCHFILLETVANSKPARRNKKKHAAVTAPLKGKKCWIQICFSKKKISLKKRCRYAKHVCFCLFKFFI